ncbi:DNA-binding transcriptional regulator KdgR [Vibrio hippocampi]|uniref:Pectin degradation repressor protein KdgR n=1 Tax=Vibrio hippocampi TaxID=654686 RepID=A0ABN8DL70_9VIBR|nr:DNA-binding transcriptional regulator KdgR [Vibrio hippocampi]CAH0528709.1 Pectin degradation repressor protein KdgR [Vibrio hippocampi]
MEKSTQPEAVSSVLKVFNILQTLGEQKEIGVSELSQRLMMSKATTYRFLQTMKGLGIVVQEGEADKYALTLKLFELGSKALEHVDLIDLADTEMRKIVNVINETVHLGCIDDGSILYLHKIDSTYHLRMHSRVGRRNPLYSTAIGKVMMADMDPNEAKQLLESVDFIKHTANTHETPEQVMEELDRVRVERFGEDNEEQEPGLRCIAVPIYDRFGHAIASISVSFPTIRFEQDKKQDYIALLHQAGKNVSEQLGFHHYPMPLTVE